MINFKYYTMLLCMFVLTSTTLIILIANCDSNTTGENDTPIDITGSWELETTVTSNTCGIPDNEIDSEIIYLEDSDDVFTITTFSGIWGNYEVEGEDVTISGSESSDELGCLATFYTSGTGTIANLEINGTSTTTVDFEPYCMEFDDCSITTSFTMTPVDETSCLDRAIFGDPDSSDYTLPYPIGQSYEVYQSYCWRTGGHRNQLAIDFTMPISDTVIAIRGGVVRGIREDSPDDGLGEGDHNYIYIEHEDGTAAFYAHLKQISVIVDPGDTVETGEYIALSGNSGLSGEPHLHIGVYEAYPPVEGEDIPINFRNADGPLDERNGLIRGEVYEAVAY